MKVTSDYTIVLTSSPLLYYLCPQRFKDSSLHPFVKLHVRRSAAWTGSFGVVVREVVLTLANEEGPLLACGGSLGFAVEHLVHEFLGSVELLVGFPSLFDIGDALAVWKVVEDIFPD